MGATVRRIAAEQIQQPDCQADNSQRMDHQHARFNYQLTLDESSSIEFVPWSLDDWDAFLTRFFGINLMELVLLLLLGLVLWKMLVIYILPAIFFRVMLYTDQMESEHCQLTSADLIHNRSSSSDAYCPWFWQDPSRNTYS